MSFPILGAANNEYPHTDLLDMHYFALWTWENVLSGPQGPSDSTQPKEPTKFCKEYIVDQPGKNPY